MRAHNPDWSSTGAYLAIISGGVPTGFKGERITIGTYKSKNGKRSGELRVVQRIVPDPDTWDRCRLAWQMRREGAALKKARVKSSEIPHLTDAILEEWLDRIRTALQSDVVELGRQAIRQFVGKVVVRENGGEIYYIFPMLGENEECRHLGKRRMDLRGYVPFPRLKPHFEIAYSDDFLAKARNTDKQKLRVTVLELRE